MAPGGRAITQEVVEELNALKKKLNTKDVKSRFREVASWRLMSPPPRPTKQEEESM